MERVLVTGGAGYLGSRLVPTLLRRGYFVRVLDLFLFVPNVFADLATHPRLEVVRGDIRDVAHVRSALRGMDVAVHLAAIANDPCGELDPAVTYEVNVDALRAMLRAAQEEGVSRLIHASSASVYGVAHTVAAEHSALTPQSVYARSKVAGELVVANANGPGFATTNLRMGTLCGYAPRLRLDLVVNTMVAEALTAGSVTVHGGDQYRPILTLGDATSALVRVLTGRLEKVGGQTFNVATRNYAVQELARLVCEEAGNEVTVEISPASDPRSYRVDYNRIRDVLGFEPCHPVRRAVRELVHAFRAGHIAMADSPEYYNIRMMRQSYVLTGVLP